MHILYRGFCRIWLCCTKLYIDGTCNRARNNGACRQETIFGPTIPVPRHMVRSCDLIHDRAPAHAVCGCRIIDEAIEIRRCGVVQWSHDPLIEIFCVDRLAQNTPFYRWPPLSLTAVVVVSCVCPKLQRYRSHCSRTSDIGLKVGGVMHTLHNITKLIAIQDGYAWPFLRVLRNFESYVDSLGPVLRDNNTAHTL